MEYYGCKIMFICGTDETKFVYENEFLEYVDIHINTDTLTTFWKALFTDGRKTAEPPRSATLRSY